MKKLIIALGLASLLLTACNTVSGIGKDVQAGGRAVQNAAQDVKDAM